MKKILITLGLFAFGFVGTYLALNHLMPGEVVAESAEQFMESFKNHMMFKYGASFIVGLIMCKMPKVLGKKND